MVFKQSIPIALFYSYLSGFLDVIATAAAAYPELEEKKGKKWPVKVWVPATATTFNLGFRLLGMFATTISTFNGPVSITTPTNQASILISNMIIFGLVMKAENFTKEIQLGTYIILIAAVLLPVVGADTTKHEHILENLSHPGAFTMSVILGLGAVISSVLIFQPSFRKMKGTDYAFYVILAAQVLPTVIGATLTKMFVLVHGWPLYISIAGAVYCLVIILYSALLQATYVKQKKFVPLETSLTIGLNELVGFVVWHDWLVVQSWLGYTCVFLLFMLGSYSLGSIEDEVDIRTDICPQNVNNREESTVIHGTAQQCRNPRLSTVTKLMEMEAELEDPLLGGQFLP